MCPFCTSYNVAVNTIFTSKVPFLFEHFDVLERIWSKTFFVAIDRKIFHPSNIFGKIFLGALFFSIQKCRGSQCPPPPIFWWMLPTPLDTHFKANILALFTSTSVNNCWKIYTAIKKVLVQKSKTLDIECARYDGYCLFEAYKIGH